MSIAVIGCGYWGKNLVRNFEELGALAMVCDATETGRATARELAPATPVVSSVDDVLASDVRAVVIATPAVTHHALAKRALLADKDVFVEKPLALTYEEGSDLVNLAEIHRRILLVGHVLEYHPAIVRVRDLLASGELGSVRYIYSNRLSLGKVRREENALWSLAPHDVAIILRLLKELPAQVSAVGGAYITPDVADVTMTNLQFGGGVRGHIFASWLHPFKEHRLVVIGERKMASYDDVGKVLMMYDSRIDLEYGQPVAIKGEGVRLAFANDEPLRLECKAFLSAVETREPPLTDGESGLAVLSVLEAAQQSLAMKGVPVAVPAWNPPTSARRPLA